MKPWRAIGAVALIFVSGAVTGALGVHALNQNRVPPPPPPWASPVDFKVGTIEAIRTELSLTADQAARVGAILEDGRARTRRVWEGCQPELRSEIRRVRDAISAELSAEQRSRFEALLQRSRARGKHRPDISEEARSSRTSAKP